MNPIPLTKSKTTHAIEEHGRAQVRAKLYTSPVGLLKTRDTLVIKVWTPRGYNHFAISHEGFLVGFTSGRLERESWAAMEKILRATNVIKPEGGSHEERSV